jgi:hypothetical protein
MKTKLKPTNGIFTARITIVAFLLLPWLTLIAQDYSKTYYNEKYDVDKGASLVIRNKFGDIHCQAWDENSVSVEVTVKVDASSQEKANRIFEKIRVELSGSRTKVEGTTTVGSINNADFSVNYEIRIPAWINIDLNNQFGDIFLDETNGPVKINLEYGAMEANSFNGPKTDLTIKFSDVETGFMKNGKINMEYSEWTSKGAENMELYSRFGEISIEKTANLNIDSQYDEVDIGAVGQLIAISRFSELGFDKINGDFDVDIEYGEIEVNYISADFKTGKIRNTFAGASLTFDPKANINIDAKLEFGELSFPKATSMNHEVVDYTTHIYKGKLGTGTGLASNLTIYSKNADVDIDFAE